jgi:hypothetical protein
MNRIRINGTKPNPIINVIAFTIPVNSVKYPTKIGPIAPPPDVPKPHMNEFANPLFFFGKISPIKDRIIGKLLKAKKPKNINQTIDWKYRERKKKSKEQKTAPKKVYFLPNLSDINPNTGCPITDADKMKVKIRPRSIPYVYLNAISNKVGRNWKIPCKKIPIKSIISVKRMSSKEKCLILLSAMIFFWSLLVDLFSILIRKIGSEAPKEIKPIIRRVYDMSIVFPEKESKMKSVIVGKIARPMLPKAPLNPNADPTSFP